MKKTPPPVEKDWLDLNEMVGADSDQVFYVTVNSVTKQFPEIAAGDIIVADCKRKPLLHDLVITDPSGNGLFEIGRVKVANVKDPNFQVWGVITHVIHKLVEDEDETLDASVVL